MKIELLDKVEKITYLTQPSPVVLVSTVDTEGIRNLAPFAMFMVASTDPPIISVGISPKSDTYKNIVSTNQFVVGIPTKDIISQLYKAGNKYEPNVDEFVETGLTPYESTLKPYRIKECHVNFDCTLEWTKETGNHNIVVGKVVAADIEEEGFSEDKVVLRNNVPKVYHITGNKFAVDGKVIEVEK